MYLNTFENECVASSENICLTNLTVFLTELTGSGEDWEPWSTGGWQEAGLNEGSEQRVESVHGEMLFTMEEFPLLCSCPADAWSGAQGKSQMLWHGQNGQLLFSSSTCAPGPMWQGAAFYSSVMLIL